jgi:transposase
MRRTPPRPWAHLTQAEVAVLRPFFQRQGAGRPIHDLPARLDAIFWVACRNGPWRTLPEPMGPWDTAHRQFRRWAHAGVWTKLLAATAAPDCPPILRALQHWICRAYRRALRVLRLPGLVHAQRLGLATALPGPFWMLPKPDLSETWLPWMRGVAAELKTMPWQEITPWLKALQWMHRFLGGASRIPRSLAPP